MSLKFSAPILITAAIGTLIAGCDSSARFHRDELFFSEAVIVSGVPAVKDSNGKWVRECSARDTEGMIHNMVMVSTQRDASDPNQQDRSIRPGDIVRGKQVDGGRATDINISGTGNVDLEVGCNQILPTPGEGPECSNGARPSVSVEGVSYLAHTDRSEPINVIVMIDQSGSTKGLVDESIDYHENKPGAEGFVIPSRPIDHASDFRGLRFTAARRFMGTLNTRDRVGFVTFNEPDNWLVPCSEAIGDFKADMNACFGKTNRAIWDNMQDTSQAGGRSKMWEALGNVYDYLADDVKQPNVANHIIVMTDGPDTCIPSEDLYSCQTPCSNKGPEELVQRIEAAQATPGAPQIKIHFVQWEHKRYGDRDPRQVEVSCLSGGHYQYINSNNFPSNSSQPLDTSLGRAMTNLRFALMGHWEIAFSDASWQNSAAQVPVGTPPGNLYATSGNLTIKASSGIVPSDTIQPFGIGQGPGGDPAWDRRPTIRKPCTGATDCGAGGDAGACTIICSGETGLCPDAAVGVDAPNNDQCTPDSGGLGLCCEGACLPTGSACSACQ